jgi:hypothetical protein
LQHDLNNIQEVLHFNPDFPIRPPNHDARPPFGVSIHESLKFSLKISGHDHMVVGFITTVSLNPVQVRCTAFCR